MFVNSKGNTVKNIGTKEEAWDKCIKINELVDTMQQKYRINCTNPLLMLMLMSCVIVENYVENP